MKRKERKLAVITTACCATVFLLGPMFHVQASGDGQSSTRAVAGITQCLDNYYKDTLKTQTIHHKEKKADKTLTKGSIGIADVSSYLNIREKASDKSEIVGVLPKNGGCYIYSVDSNGWAKISSGKITGYVDSEYLIMGDDVTALAKQVGAKIATVIATTVRIREEKSLDSGTMALVPKGEELEVLEDSDKDWIYVRIDSDKGYINRKYVDVKYQLAKAMAVGDGAMETLGSAASDNSLRSQMVRYAKKFLGGKYVYGGTSLKTGIDCSAFMMRIYEHFGYNISRTSRSQADEGVAIKLKNLRPGDLVFYDKDGTINHVAMYIGNGKIIHASNRVSGIKISNMNYKVPFKAVRILDE